ncbi:MAG: mechanosensitive ion channel, partial [Phycisphaerae bacterium]|nr:mechanosensitive ion channel [candidate division Zixibacteria bacterium]NIS25990.1 mechanosensitive ion channel [candidate division KSB1 bacterium]NIV01610.1 mechanosensitive ion channel [Phycisphaerae bacterium]NIS15919.1 mechanosensitive ion channel [candidate division Zixibacteria bacterium]NIU26658.1 mechanosensitive ion channel [candidate division KSB1 bacterium]
GGKIRKGDWIEVGSMLGEVTDIYLRATKVRTRDNIEYLVPNSNIISNTMVNYSLSSPLIRIELPVGVS